MKIDKLYIENFKGIKSAQPNLGDLTIITGKNSSGKSSIIQALKYITQWINRIERTRNLGSFSFPALNIFHPDFINENRDYISVRNSLTKDADGIALGFDSQFGDRNNVYDEGLHFKSYFENIAQEGELVRPVGFDIKSSNYGDEDVQSYDILYSDDNSLEVIEKRSDYARKYCLGLILNYKSKFGEWNFDDYLSTAGPGGYWVDIGGKSGHLHYLHEHIHEEFKEIKKELMPILIGNSDSNQNLNEDAIAINSESELISFDSVQNLKMKKQGSEKNLFFSIFSAYIDKSVEHHTSSYPITLEKEDAEKFFEHEDDLKKVIKKIFRYIVPILDSEHQQTFLKYLQHDLASANPDEGDVELGGPDVFIEGLNKKLIVDLTTSPEIRKKLTVFTNWINKQRQPGYYLMITQILSMFYIYFQSLSTKDSHNLNINRSVTDFLEDNDIFTDEQSVFTMRDPVEKIINSQNLLGTISKLVGHLRSDDIVAYNSDACGCYSENFYVLTQDDYVPRRLTSENEVVRPCPRGSQIIEHVYRLTSPEEIKSQEPNDFSQYPVVNFRAYNGLIVTGLLEILQQLYFENSNSNKADTLFKLLFPQLEKEKKLIDSSNLAQEKIDQEMFYRTQRNQLAHGRSKFDKRFFELEKKLDKLQEERWKLESTLEKRMYQLEEKIINQDKLNSTQRKFEKDIAILQDRIELIYKKEFDIKSEISEIQQNRFEAKDFYLSSSKMDSVPRSLSEKYEEALRELKNLKAGIKFETQELEKLRQKAAVLKSEKQSLAKNKVNTSKQNIKQASRMRDLDLRMAKNTIQMKIKSEEIKETDKVINKLMKETKELEREIDFNIAKGSSVKELNKELNEFEANYKGRIFDIDKILNTTFIQQTNNLTFNLNELSSNIKFLNTGRSTSPNQLESPGAFYENLPVGKFGGMLAEVIYSQSKTPIAPFLYPSNESDEPDRGIDGLTWEINHGDEGDTIYFESALNKWIKYLGLEVTEVKGVMEGPTPVLKVKGKDNVERNIFEVGSGVGQVLPVLAICLLAKPGDIVCIEEPEAHLHPSAQAYLSDFLISMSASGRQIIVETHSPNIIDRLRLRKAHKKSWNRLQNTNWIKNDLYLANPNDYGSNFNEPEIRITYADQDSSGVSLYSEATINNSGDILFRDRQQALWPEGFFDTAQEEISRIIQARSLFEEE